MNEHSSVQMFCCRGVICLKKHAIIGFICECWIWWHHLRCLFCNKRCLIIHFVKLCYCWHKTSWSISQSKFSSCYQSLETSSKHFWWDTVSSATSHLYFALCNLKKITRRCLNKNNKLLRNLLIKITLLNDDDYIDDDDDDDDSAF